MEIVQFPARGNNIVAQLRQLADELEKGDIWGDVPEVALVLNTSGGIEVFGWGISSDDGTSAHYLLACGMSRLQAPLVKNRYQP